MEYNESMNKIEEPYFDGIKRRYELIEKRIKDFHDKSRLTGTNSLIYTKDEFSPFLNNSPKEQIKENFELQKNLQNLQNEYDIKKKQLKKEYEKQILFLEQEFEKESSKLHEQSLVEKRNDLKEKKRSSLGATLRKPKETLVIDPNNLKADHLHSNLNNSNRILHEMKQNLAKEPKQYKSYIRQEALISKVERIKKDLDIPKSKSKTKTTKNQIKNKENHCNLIRSQDDEDSEKFLRNYRLFKEKYLLKESLKPTKKKGYNTLSKNKDKL